MKKNKKTIKFFMFLNHLIFENLIVVRRSSNKKTNTEITYRNFTENNKSSKTLADSRMSSPMWVTLNGVRYPINRSEEPRTLHPGEWAIEKETFIHSGSEWQTVKNLTVEEAMQVRDLNRSLRLKQAGSGECVVIYDEGQALIWCKETNLLYEKMEGGETPMENSFTGKISEHYSEKLHAMCVGRMVQDGGQWVPEDKASWNQSDRCCVENFSWTEYDKSLENSDEE